MFVKLLSNEIFILVLAVASGLILGKISIGRVSLGTSGCLLRV